MYTHLYSPHRGQGSLKAIAAIGVIAFLFLMLSSFGLKKGLQPDEQQRLTGYRAESDVNGARAYTLARELFDLGPRPSGSETLQAARERLTAAARDAGLTMQSESFSFDNMEGVNLYVEQPGNRPGIIVLATQFDTAVIPDFAYRSANDGTADAALLFELARALKDHRHGRTLRFVWFDGTQGDAGSAGPTYHLEKLSSDGRLGAVHAIVTLRMVGDCYLNATTTANSSEALTNIFLETAQRHGLHQYIGAMPNPPDTRSVGDPFRAVDIPLLAIADTQYGGSLLAHTKRFRGPEDSIEEVCPDSLQAIGDVVYHALPAIDGYLGRR